MKVFQWSNVDWTEMEKEPEEVTKDFLLVKGDVKTQYSSFEKSVQDRLMKKLP